MWRPQPLRPMRLLYSGHTIFSTLWYVCMCRGRGWVVVGRGLYCQSVGVLLVLVLVCLHFNCCLYVVLTGVYCLCCADRCLSFMLWWQVFIVYVVLTGVYIVCCFESCLLSCCDSGLLCLYRYGAWFVGQRAVTRPQVQGRQKSRRIKSTR